MMKYILFAILMQFLNITSNCIAQEQNFMVGNYFTVGVEIPFVKYLDKGHSPNLYKSKRGIAVYSSFSDISNKYISKFSMKYISSTLNNSKKGIINTSYSSFFNLLLKYEFGISALQKNQFIYYVGTSIAFNFVSNDYNNLKSNNSYSFNNRILLNIEGNGFYNFKPTNSAFHMSANHTLSVLNFDARAAYITMFPFDGIQPNFRPKKLLKESKLITFNRFLSMFQQINLGYRYGKTNNFIGLSHSYHYSYNFHSSHNLYTGYQGVGLNASILYR